jgi:two-component system, cell cycle sensor histidine kinase and response regulator CckA
MPDRACIRCGELAHDINNLLAVILCCCEMLEQQTGLPSSARTLIGQIQSAGLSARDLSEDVLSTIREKPTRSGPQDLNRLVQTVQALFSCLAGDSIRIRTVLSSRPVTVHAAPGQLERILMNLLSNARDAMPHGGAMQIETSIVTNTQSGLPRPMLAVTDTGHGMDQKTQKQIFQAGFTTKTGAQGCGLGLSIVAGIARHAGWEITVESSPGAGTTFRLFFPPSLQTLPALPADLFPVQARGNETILLVEDSDSLRTLTSKLLTDCGYHVLDAHCAAEALRTAHAHRGTISLLITDLSLPGISGITLARNLRRILPGLAALYTSGYSDHTLQPNARIEPHSFLEKPFTRNELLIKVRGLLDSQQTHPRFGPETANLGSVTPRSRNSRKIARLACG